MPISFDFLPPSVPDDYIYHDMDEITKSYWETFIKEYQPTAETALDGFFLVDTTDNLPQLVDKIVCYKSPYVGAYSVSDWFDHPKDTEEWKLVPQFGVIKKSTGWSDVPKSMAPFFELEQFQHNSWIHGGTCSIYNSQLQENLACSSEGWNTLYIREANKEELDALRNAVVSNRLELGYVFEKHKILTIIDNHASSIL